MFNWIRRRLADRRRRIFKYWGGDRYRRIDPVRAYFALQEHPTFNAAVHLKLCDAGDPEGTRITCEAVREVFEVDSYEPAHPRGLTLGEQLGLLLAFYDYLDAQKKTGGSSLTSRSSTEESTCSGCNGTTTEPSSDCGAAATGPTCGEATPSG